ncbi:MAG TPA: carboxylating nicotinate-nucleotide diphosphorylase [Chitinophagales bacterium]|nr:carboxylating nicotinate-nucleotide diphosphorylase [Chitinophagales bacterium]
MYNVEKFIEEVLLEDIADPEGKIPPGDHTSLACIPQHKDGRARLLCKANGILAGVELAGLIAAKVDPDLKIEFLLKDGNTIKPGDVAFNIYGEVKSILRAERVILNFMQRMSGIATHTARFVEKINGTGTQVLDTRKTTPGLRYFEKWAVRIGGGHNLRYGLFDMILIKDNHIDFCGGVKQAITAAYDYLQKNNLNLPVEVETRSMKDVEEALATGHIQRIMFDNFTLAQMKEAVKVVNKQVETEASGGINLENVRPIAETGVDFVSVGALTHSSVSLDLSLKAF